VIAHLLLALAGPAAAAPRDTGNTIRFTPTIRLYECPPTFTYRSDCNAKETTLDPQKLELNVQVISNRTGQWVFHAANPVPADFYVIVVRGPVSGHWEYSVSVETGIPGTPAPYANSRVEFPESAVPQSFGVSSATLEKDGKKYLTEIRLADFHGPPIQRKKP
jgi:hypothetical protein